MQEPQPQHEPFSALRYHQDDLKRGPGTVYGHILNIIGENKRVLEAGPATGYLTRILRERGCQVTCIEIDPLAAQVAEEFSDKMIVGNIEEMDLPEMFGEAAFDVAVFGDVLEHLIDPWAVLRQVAKVLRPGGYVAASLPNIAHGSVRMALMEGRFDYTDLGLLDRTHLRFFTMETLYQLFRDSGYHIDEWQFVLVDPFSTADIPLSTDNYPASLIETLRTDPESLAFQFVVRALPVPTEETSAAAKDSRPSPVVQALRQLRAEEEQVPLLVEQSRQRDARIGQLQALLHEAERERDTADDRIAEADERLKARQAEFLVALEATKDELQRDKDAALMDAAQRYKSVVTQLIDTLSSQQAALQSAAVDRESWEAILASLSNEVGVKEEALQNLRAGYALLEADRDRIAAAQAALMQRQSYRLAESIKRYAPYGSIRYRLLSLPLKALSYLLFVGPLGFAARLLQPWKWGKGEAAPVPVAEPVDPAPDPAPVLEEPVAAVVDDEPPEQKSPEGIEGWFDFPEQDAEVDSDVCQIRGWALARYEIIDRVEISVDGQFVGLARLGLPRPDVASAIDLPAAEVCGFHMDLDLSGRAEPGDYIAIAATAYTSSGRSLAFPERIVRLRDDGGDKLPVVVKRAAKRIPDGTKKQIRVGVFAHDLGYGGGQLYLTELIEQLLPREDLSFVVVAPREGPLRGYLEKKGIEVDVLNTADVSEEDLFWDKVSALSAWLQAADLDLVISNTLRQYMPPLAAAEAGIPCIWALHESYTLPGWGAFVGLSDESERRALSRRLQSALAAASALVFEADATRDMYARYAKPSHLKKVTYGINTDEIDRFQKKFDRAAARRRLGFEDGDKVILSMAAFEPRKQLTVLSQAFAQIAHKHRDTKLLLVGDWDCDYSDSLHAYIDAMKLGDRIVTVPMVPDALPWYAVSDYFALISDIESMPRSLMESMYMGVPVLATDVFGVPELVHEGETGYLVEVNHASLLADRLDHLLSVPDAELRQVTGNARRLIKERYNSTGYAKAFGHLIVELAGVAAATT